MTKYKDGVNIGSLKFGGVYIFAPTLERGARRDLKNHCVLSCEPAGTEVLISAVAHNHPTAKAAQHVTTENTRSFVAP